MKECCAKYLAEQFGGDDDLANEIYGEYVKSLGEKVAEAAAAFEARDWQALDRAAHTVKGNALSVGDTSTADSAISLRQAAKLEDADAAAPLIAELREALGTL